MGGKQWQVWWQINLCFCLPWVMAVSSDSSLDNFLLSLLQSNPQAGVKRVLAVFNCFHHNMAFPSFQSPQSNPIISLTPFSLLSGSWICPCFASQSLWILLGLSTQPIPHHSSSAWPERVQGMPGTALALLHRAWSQAPLLRPGSWGIASMARGGAVLKKPSAVAWNGCERRRWSGSSKSPYRLPGPGGEVDYLL